MENRRPTWLSRNLLVLSGVSLLQDAASDLVYPVLPIFLTVTLGAPVAAVGIVEGVAEGFAAISKLVAGQVADRRRRRPLVALGYGLAAVGKGLVAVAGVWPVVLLGRGVDRVGKGIRASPRDALIVVGVPPARRGSAFGVHRAADNAGAVLGPLMGLALYALFHHHIRPLLVAALVPAVLSFALIAAVHEPRAVPAGADDPAKAHLAFGPETVGGPSLPQSYWKVLVALSLFSLVNLPDALLLLRASRLGLSLPGVLVAYLLFNASATLLAYPAGALSDRLPRRGVYAVGLVAFAVTTIGLSVATSAAWAYPLFAGYGVFTACTDGVGKAWVSALAPPARQGAAQGFYQGAVGIAVLLAGVWGGLAFGATGSVPLQISGVVAGVVAISLLAGGRWWEAALGAEPDALLGEPDTARATEARHDTTTNGRARQ